MQKNEKKINIYKVVGEVGKSVKRFGGYAIAATITYAITKGPDIIKKIKK